MIGCQLGHTGIVQFLTHFILIHFNKTFCWLYFFQVSQVCHVFSIKFNATIIWTQASLLHRSEPGDRCIYQITSLVFLYSLYLTMYLWILAEYMILIRFDAMSFFHLVMCRLPKTSYHYHNKNCSSEWYFISLLLNWFKELEDTI